MYPSTDLDILERALVQVTEMLDRVLAYVRSVLAGEVKGDAAVGRYLMDTFGASTEELARASGEVPVGAAPDASTALYTLVNRDDGGPTADANGGNDRNDEEVTQRDH